MHKQKIYGNAADKLKISSDVDLGLNEDSSSIPDIDLEKEDRLSRVLSLHSKGYSQSEIAEALIVNQSTISRDLELIKKEARRKLTLYLKQDIPFEFFRIMKGYDEIIKTTWQTIDSKQVSCKDKHNLLNLLDTVYTKRLQLIIGGDPKGGGSLNLKDCVNSIRVDEMIPMV